ncbi:hypothetical protein JOM56_015340 [Amanita muscaria]
MDLEKFGEAEHYRMRRKEIKCDSQCRAFRRQLQHEDHKSHIREFFLHKGIVLPQRNSTGQFQAHTPGSTAPGGSSIAGSSGHQVESLDATITNNHIINHHAQGSVGDSCNQEPFDDDDSTLQQDFGEEDDVSGQQGNNDIEMHHIESGDQHFGNEDEYPGHANDDTPG